MNLWLLAECLLVVLLVLALVFRARLGQRFQLVSISLSGLVIAFCLLQWLQEGPQPWSLGLGVVALVFFGVEIKRQSGRTPPP